MSSGSYVDEATVGYAGRVTHHSSYTPGSVPTVTRYACHFGIQIPALYVYDLQYGIAWLLTSRSGMGDSRWEGEGAAAAVTQV